MSTQRYSVTPHPIETLLTWVKSGEVANPAIRIAIGDKAPGVYFKELAEQCDGGKKKYGGITDAAALRANLRMSCLPESLLDGEVPDYDAFLEQRRQLMARKIKTWFEAL